MSTWVPGCLVTSSDGSVGVSPSVGGGSALSSVSGNIVDLGTYALSVPTAIANNVFTPILTAPAVATTFTLKKGATYMLYAPYSIQWGAIVVPAATTGMYIVQATLNIPNGTGGVTSTTLDQWTQPLNITGFPLTGTISSSLVAPITFPSNAGPAVGTTGYDPSYVKGCYITYGLSVYGTTSALVNNIGVGSANLTGNLDACVLARVL